jgi:hypothetical protein
MKLKENEIYLDPFKATGHFYNSINNKKYWCEITENKDFFKFNKNVDVICSNPPYSLLDKVLEHTSNICNRFGYLIRLNALTPRRIEKLNNKGFYISYIHICKVYKWFGMSVFVIFDKTIKKNIINYDRIVWK